MKKYSNGQYIEMNPDEISEWEESQQEIDDVESGSMALIGTYEVEEGSSEFIVPVGSKYTDVLIELENLTLNEAAAGKLYFDETEVSSQTVGTFYTASPSRKQLWIHNYGGYVDAIFKTIAYGTQISLTNCYTINSSKYPGMPNYVKFALNATTERNFLSGTAKVYARINDIQISANCDYRQLSNDITSLQKEVSMLSPGIIESAKGETILVTDSSNKAFAGMRQYGRTTQETTTGAQLLPTPYQDNELISDGLTFIAHSDGSIQINGTSTKTEGLTFFYFRNNIAGQRFKLPAGEYFFNCILESSAMRCILAKYSIDGNVVFTNGKSFTLDSESELFGYIAVNAGATVNDTFYPMLNAGSNALPWEPYTGGFPSPNPEYPQELVSVGDKGSVEVDVLGGNLFSIKDFIPVMVQNCTYKKTDTGVKLTSDGEGTDIYCGLINKYNENCFYYDVTPETEYFVSFTATYSNPENLKNYRMMIGFFCDKEFLEFRDQVTSSVVFATPPRCNKLMVRFGLTQKVAAANEVCEYSDVMINLGSTAFPYEPYTKQSIIHSIPNGLHGIPVSSGGNYTDENGQQWVADYRDWGRGVDVQMVSRKTLTKNDSWAKENSLDNVGNYTRFTSRLAGSINSKTRKEILCNKGIYASSGNRFATCFLANGMSYYCLGYESDIQTNDDFAEQILGEDGIEVIYPLATPIETPIPEDELMAYRALHSNYPITTIINDEGIYTEVEYVADTETYINNNYVPKDTYTALEERVAALEQNAIS